MERKRILQFLCLTIGLLLFLPMLQQTMSVFRIAPLEGSFLPPQKPESGIKRYLDGEFQPEFEKYLDDVSAFRPLFVRLRNQWDFVFYRKAHAEGVIIGKKGVIIEEDYILEYLGRLFIGEKTIRQKLGRVKFVQDTLDKLGIKLSIVFTPGKASFYPELIPDRYHPEKRGISNYSMFIKVCDELRVNYLDLNRFFVDLKPHAPYPLYTTYGTHWSYYGMCLAADTLVKYTEWLLHKPMNRLIIGSIEVSDKPRDTDFDGGRSMNLLWKPRLEAMAYPNFGFENNPSKFRPLVLVVADSYYWNIFNTGLPKNLFANEAFWYYNHQVYPDYYFGPKTVDQLNLKEETEKQDVIYVMITERFLYTAFWNFTDDLYRLYKPGYTEDHIYNNGNSIRRVREWLEHVRIKARNKGLSLEEMITLDAEYMFLTGFDKMAEKTFDDYILYYTLTIKRDDAWLADVERKAREQGISTEEMLFRDAVWLYEKNILGLHP